MKKISLILSFIVILSLVPGVAPDAAADTGGQPFDGYIIKLKQSPPPRLFGADSGGIDSVYAKEGFYKSDDLTAITDLAEAGLIEYIEPNYVVTLIDDTVEVSAGASLFASMNDPYYERQWNIINLGIETAWSYGLSGKGVRVAVIDSGINAGHEDFIGTNIEKGINAINGSADVSDKLGHGTFISGVIAAGRGNGRGIAGILDDVTIVPIKCFNSSNTNLDCIISAIYIAIDDFYCDIINMSLGSANDTKAFREAVGYAESNNVFIISSVGNEYSSQLFYPAAYDSVIGVGSVGENMMHSNFSQTNTSVFVCAPGENIYSLGISDSKSYRMGSGTSFAAPHVTAMAAMALGKCPGLTLAQFKELLIDSSVGRSPQGNDIYYGYGIVDYEDFAVALQGFMSGQNAPEPTDAGRAARDELVYSGTSYTSEYDISGWFFDNSGAALSYSVYSSTTYGNVSINGSRLRYTVSAKDVDKSLRIVVSAYNGVLWSSENAILTINVLSDDYSSAADIFTDMAGHWAKKYVAYGVDRGLLNGISETLFGPDRDMTRAMFVTVLARLSGEDLSGYYPQFSDVNKSDWYGESVAWAQAKGIVDGVGGGLFAPSRSISRQDMAVIMQRYARLYGQDGKAADDSAFYGYSDTDQIALWAKDALLWSISNGLISGKTGSILDPAGFATRAEVSAILARFCRSFI